MPFVLSAGTAAGLSFGWGLVKGLMPLPSPSGFALLGAEAVRPAGGPASAAGRLLAFVIAPGSVGMVLGAWPYFVWARRGGREAVERWGPRLGFPAARVRDVERRAARSRRLLVFGLYAVPLTPVVVGSVAGGILGLEASAFAYAALAGAVVRCGLLAAVGYAFRASFGDPLRLLKAWPLSGLVPLALFALLLLLRPRRS